MDEEEYKLIDINYSEEDKKKVNEYNQQHYLKACDLLKYNRDKILNDKEYEKLTIEKRIELIQKNEDFKEFCKTYPIVSKYIIAFGLFSKKAFIKYLNWKARIRPTDMLRAKLVGNQREQEKYKNKYIYAIYIKYLYQSKVSHVNLSEINSMYIKTVEDLNKDTDAFFDLYEKEVEIQKQNEKDNNEEKKQKIINQLKMKYNNN